MIVLPWLQLFHSTSTEVYMDTGQITSKVVFYDLKKNCAKTSEIFVLM